MKTKPTLKITCVIEIGAEADPFENLDTNDRGLHEALCKSIHENDNGAASWLTTNVINIDADNDNIVSAEVEI